MNSRGKIVAVILGLSLAINFLIVGIWVGHRVSGPPRDRFDGPARLDFSLRQFREYLPEEKREQVRALMKNHREALRESFLKVWEAEERIRTLLAEETVDRDALAQALSDHEALMQDLHSPIRTILLEVVADLDVDARRALAKNMFRRPWAKEIRDGRFGDGPPPGGPDGMGPEGMPPPPPPFDRDDEEGPGGR